MWQPFMSESENFSFVFMCVQCGMSCHKKCLSSLQFKCGNPHKLLQTAGSSDTDLPESLLWVLPQCIGEINERGLDVKVTATSYLTTQSANKADSAFHPSGVGK